MQIIGQNCCYSDKPLFFSICPEPILSIFLNTKMRSTKTFFSFHTKATFSDISLGAAVRYPSICFWLCALDLGSKNLHGEKSKGDSVGNKMFMVWG